MIGPALAILVKLVAGLGPAKPDDYKSTALPIAPHQQIAQMGLEPMTFRI